MGYRKRTGIYKIQSIKKPERIYIGSALNIFRRWAQHADDLRKNAHTNSKLQRHYNKYGQHDLQFSILVGCDDENLIPNEQFFIDAYNPYFNMCKVAMSSLGIKRSDETKERIRQVRLGSKSSDEAKFNVSKALKGVKKSPQHCENIRVAKLGKKRPAQSEEWKRKISEGVKRHYANIEICSN